MTALLDARAGPGPLEGMEGIVSHDKQHPLFGPSRPTMTSKNNATKKAHAIRLRSIRARFGPKKIPHNKTLIQVYGLWSTHQSLILGHNAEN